MKSMHGRRVGTLGLFLAILAAACMLAIPASAKQPLFKGTFTLANETHWGQNVLPAGDYTLVLDQDTHTIAIYDASDRVVARRVATISSNPQNGESKLLIFSRGGRRDVYSMQVAGYGEVFESPRLAAQARRAAAEEAQSVPIKASQVAEK